MGKLTLYGIDLSPPVRAVLLTLEALDLSFEYVQINLFAREVLSPEFRQKNPTSTVPTLEDDGHFIWDSHAINAYLVEKYATTDQLYPKDLLQRAVVDQCLFFETGALFFGALRPITRPLLLENQTDVPKQKLDGIIEVYNIIETFLNDHEYVAGNNLTIADFSLITSVTVLESLVEISKEKYVKTIAWMDRLKNLPYYEEACGKGAKDLTALIKSKKINIIA